MKKLLAATLLLAVCASPVFAKSKKHPDYSYKAPKSYKVHFHKQKQKMPHQQPKTKIPHQTPYEHRPS